MTDEKRSVDCSRCGKHMGWMNDTGPCGSFYCDGCKDDDED